ncbi:hypothetical protein AB0F30_16755 [Streptomyces sp. NPDC029006]|uniref:hypothetical protein n=1 Tax=Streptomyces sp. NPDC029006 TaxID=3155467 RepID=UPI0033E79003
MANPEYLRRTEQFTGDLPDRPLPPLVDGWCPWKESGPDGDRICMLPQGHDGDCEMQEVSQ